MSSITIGPFVVGEKPAQLEYQFLDSAGAAMNLAGYAVKFSFGERDGIRVTRDGALVDAATGKVRYVWQGDEWPTPGHYLAELWVGNGSNRFASLRLEFDVRSPVHTVPGI